MQKKSNSSYPTPGDSESAGMMYITVTRIGAESDSQTQARPPGPAGPGPSAWQADRDSDSVLVRSLTVTTPASDWHGTAGVTGPGRTVTEVRSEPEHRVTRQVLVSCATAGGFSNLKSFKLELL
jgi:hypothetical protein